MGSVAYSKAEEERLKVRVTIELDDGQVFSGRAAGVEISGEARVPGEFWHQDAVAFCPGDAIWDIWIYGLDSLQLKEGEG